MAQNISSICLLAKFGEHTLLSGNNEDTMGRWTLKCQIKHLRVLQRTVMQVGLEVVNFQAISPEAL